MLIVIPNNPLSTNLIKSFFSIFSVINDFITQKIRPANKTLRKTKADGPILSGITPLATM